MGELHALRISEMTKGLREKKFSAAEVVEAHFARIHALQPKLNAFLHVDHENAMRRAREIDAAMRGGEARGSLLGAPLSIKGCIDVAGWPSPAGSLLRKTYVAAGDAPLAARLRNAGAILIGNTNTPEFLMAYETDNRIAGKTSNPWSLNHSAGGSSGGEAAAIAAGCSSGGVGSDGGGSIRVPAHFCGICGLKPTPGRIPITGHFPEGGGAFGWIGVAGPMARTVADLRALFSAMAGPDAGDPLSAPIAAREHAKGELRGMRIGILESDALGRVTPETASAVERAGRLLESAGFRVEPLRMRDLERALELWWFFFGPVIAYLIAGAVNGHQDAISPMLREYLAVAMKREKPSLDMFLKMCMERDAVRANLMRQMADVPVLLSAVSAGPAFRHGGGSYAGGTGYLETMRHSQWLNLAGFPGASVPMRMSEEGLPIGVQVIGRPNEDELVMTVAEVLEEARGEWVQPVL
jgi:Asp-tRNA(Asn)/Glu-tRNA(Gln) amidotransferase A subunit family amidase